MSDKMIVDASTGDVVIVPLTADDVAMLSALDTRNVAQESEADAKVQARLSAIAKLAAIGLTEEEAAALIGQQPLA